MGGHILLALTLPFPTRRLQGHHLVADAAALRRAAAAGAAGGGSSSSSGPRTLMLFRGCPRPLGSTILLQGSDAGELRRVKRVASFAAYAAYWGLLESALLSDQLAAAAAAVLPGGCQPEAVAGLADAVASTSFLATAEARGRQAILSASPHVSVLLERGAPADELELPATPGGEQEAAAGSGSSGSGEAGGSTEAEAEGEADLQWGGEPPDSPASCDSTQLWALPAEAGAATFTVSGSQSQTEMDELDAAQQQPGAGAAAGGVQQQLAEGAAPPQAPQDGSGGGTPVAGANGAFSGAPPGSPQDPLHLAAKELALQQLQLTGSDPPSPAAALDAAAAALGHDAPEPQQHVLSARGSESDSAAAQPSSQSSALAVAAAAATQQASLGGEASWGAAGSGAVPPALLAYRSQQLWLTISCKNPAKGVLCEPAHAHCMQFYADTGGAGVRVARLARCWTAGRAAGTNFSPTCCLPPAVLMCPAAYLVRPLQTCPLGPSCRRRRPPTASARTRSAATARRCTCGPSCMPTAW